MLSTLLLLILASFMYSGQTWYEVTMSPNDEIVLLKSFDGFTAYSWLSPILLVCLAAAFVSALISRNGSRIVLAFGFLISSLLFALVLTAVFNQDLGGVAKQLEISTGIAATHGITGLGFHTTQFAYLSLALFFLVAATFLYCLITQKSWAIRATYARAQAPRKSSRSEPKNSIAIWDDQR